MKLITKGIAVNLIAAYAHSAETGEGGKEVLAKLFTPWANATWFISEGQPVDADGEPCELADVKDWRLFGFCDLGDPAMAELGYIMLSDIEGLKGPAGLKVERDLLYSGTMAEVSKQYNRAT